MAYGSGHERVPGIDGIPRAFEIKTKNGLITRPVQRIHDLELEGGRESQNEISLLPLTKDNTNDNVNNDHTDSHKPEMQQRQTRSGRVIRPIHKLDL